MEAARFIERAVRRYSGCAQHPNFYLTFDQQKELCSNVNLGSGLCAQHDEAAENCLACKMNRVALTACLFAERMPFKDTLSDVRVFLEVHDGKLRLRVSVPSTVRKWADSMELLVENEDAYYGKAKSLNLLLRWDELDAHVAETKVGHTLTYDLEFCLPPDPSMDPDDWAHYNDDIADLFCFNLTGELTIPARPSPAPISLDVCASLPI